MVTAPESLAASCANHEKDRHVLATAIQGRAKMIVTANLRHFPPSALKPWGISGCHPSDYLVALHALNAGVMLARLTEIARKRKRSPERHLAFLGKSVPSFAFAMATANGWDLPDLGA